MFDNYWNTEFPYKNLFIVTGGYKLCTIFKESDGIDCIQMFVILNGSLTGSQIVLSDFLTGTCHQKKILSKINFFTVQGFILRSKGNVWFGIFTQFDRFQCPNNSHIYHRILKGNENHHWKKIYLSQLLCAPNNL